MTFDVRQAWDSGSKPRRKRVAEDAPPDTPDPVDPWDDAPFTPLGKAGKVFYFLDASGDLIEFGDARLSQWVALLTLCGGDRGWLKSHWRKLDRDGEPVDDFEISRHSPDGRPIRPSERQATRRPTAFATAKVPGRRPRPTPPVSDCRPAGDSAGSSDK